MSDPTIQIKTLKLTSGEEVISQILNLSDPDRWYMLEYPLRVEHWVDNEGMDRYELLPFLFSSNDFHLRLRTSSVIVLANPNKVMLRRYRKVAEAMDNSAEAMESLHRRGHTSK
jgi:glutamine synthetase type III